MDARNTTVILLTATEGVEQVELTSPRTALDDAGVTTLLVSTEDGLVQGFDHLTAADTFPVDRTVDDVDLDQVDAIVLPGGVANPDALRLDDRAVDLLRRAVTGGTPVAAICHAPWILIEADVVAGRRMTSWPSLATDLRNAGAEWVDEEVVRCDGGAGPLVTSRKPDDLPAFNRAVLELVGG